MEHLDNEGISHWELKIQRENAKKEANYEGTVYKQEASCEHNKLATEGWGGQAAVLEPEPKTSPPGDSGKASEFGFVCLFVHLGAA